MPNECVGIGDHNHRARRMRGGVYHLPARDALRKESGGCLQPSLFVVIWEEKGEDKMNDGKAFEFKPCDRAMEKRFASDQVEILKNIDKNIAMIGAIVQDLWRKDNLEQLTRFNTFVAPEKLPEGASRNLNAFRDGAEENSDHGISKDNE